jgi:hypothetical protein
MSRKTKGHFIENGPNDFKCQQFMFLSLNKTL